jgi:hypothetical protein
VRPTPQVELSLGPLVFGAHGPRPEPHVLTGSAGRIGRNVAARGGSWSAAIPFVRGTAGREIADAQKHLADELWRRRSLLALIAALKADDDPDRLLPKDTRPCAAAVAEKTQSKRYPYKQAWVAADLTPLERLARPRRLRRRLPTRRLRGVVVVPYPRDAFSAAVGGSYARARTICAGCLVRQECLQECLAVEAVTMRQRCRRRRRRSRRRSSTKTRHVWRLLTAGAVPAGTRTRDGRLVGRPAAQPTRATYVLDGSGVLWTAPAREQSLYPLVTEYLPTTDGSAAEVLRVRAGCRICDRRSRGGGSSWEDLGGTCTGNSVGPLGTAARGRGRLGC